MIIKIHLTATPTTAIHCPMTLRFWHRWISLLIAIPFGIILLSGILMATRGFNPWMQPQYKSSSSKELKISFAQMLAAVQSVPQARMQTWADISQIDIRPKNGQLRIRSKYDHWEVQVDSATGEVLGVGQRRVAWFTALHEGALFGEGIRYGVFFTSAIGVFFLLISGIFIFFQPYWRKAKNRKKKEPHAIC